MANTETLSIVIEAAYRGSDAFRQARDDIAGLKKIIDDSLGNVVPDAARNGVAQFNRQLGAVRAVTQELAQLGIIPPALVQQVTNATQAMSRFKGALASATADQVVLTSAVAAGALAIAGIAVVAGKAVKEIGDYGQVVVQTENRFNAFSGSAEKASKNLRLMQEATEYGLSAMDAMQTSSLLLSMGLADTGEKAAQIARAAVMLGPAWRDAEANIQDFTMLLGNQSVRRLDQFGLSISEVKKRQKELMDLGLASDLAFTNSVLEASTKRLEELGKAGVVAATGHQKLQSAIADLRKEISKPLAGPVSSIESWLARQIRSLYDPNIALENVRDVFLKEREREIEKLNSLIAQRRPGDLADGIIETQIREAEQRIRSLNDQLDLLPGKFIVAADAARQLPDTLERINAARISLAVSGLGEKTALTYSYLPEYETTEGQFSSRYGPGIIDRLSPAKRYLEKLEEAERVQNEMLRTTLKATSASGEAVSSAVDSIVAGITGKIGQAIGFSTNLRDLRIGGAGGMLAPGVGGPFEDIYRLQAWLSDNTWGNIAAKYGIMSKEQGAEIVRRFQAGLWDETVTRMIDTEKIKEMVLTERQAEAFKRAFAERIAGVTGVGTDAVAATIWGKEYTDARAQTNVMTQTGLNMADGIVHGATKARTDLEQAGYDAAMSYRFGWIRGSSEWIPKPSSPSYNEKKREIGIE